MIVVHFQDITFGQEMERKLKWIFQQFVNYVRRYTIFCRNLKICDPCKLELSTNDYYTIHSEEHFSAHDQLYLLIPPGF
jgi:hypothetical protein